MQARALAIYPKIRDNNKSAEYHQARLEEISGLVQAIEVELYDSMMINVSKINAGTFIGSGSIEKITNLVKEAQITLVIIDTRLSPVQQRNLEKAFNAKVIDRTALIIEIFGKRARTKEGVLQVELAHLSYEKSRLVRSWTHLERQRGGRGFLGGPGERQLELDKRMLEQRIKKIKQELEQVKRTRGLHRAARKKVPYKIVALVGYTNAGKSTLFNRLTKASVQEKDMLFTTLDPTMRKIYLPSKESVILSDTVGFISEIPTELIEAFSATLEEVANADIILHVRDISNPDTEKQKQDVLNILSGLVDEFTLENKTIEVLNKIDLFDDTEQDALLKKAEKNKKIVSISAKTGVGKMELLNMLGNM